MIYILLAFLFLLLLLVIYVVFGGPKLPEETNRIIEEVSKSELSHIIKGKTGYAQSSKVKIWYECLSPNDVPKGNILLNIGMGANCMFWPPKFIQSFINEGYQVIRYDSRGTGLSDWMENWDSKNPYLLTDMANDAVAVLDELHIEKVHIIGLSLGGMIAQEVAIAYPERIVSLTLLSTSPNVADAELQGMSIIKLLRTAISVLPSIKYRIMGGEKNLAKEVIAKTISVFGYDDLNIKELAELTIYDLKKRKGTNLRAINQHRVAAACTRSRYELLKKLTIPTFIVHGTADQFFPIDHGKKILELIPNATILWLDGVMHQFPYPDMTEVQSKIISHINKSNEYE
jgi:pimeloyl-ACP methyl ester carboxylesterase